MAESGSVEPLLLQPQNKAKQVEPRSSDRTRGMSTVCLLAYVLLS